ncbi:methyltransferase domain-containing protein [Candidatus Pacearchaeota archaeon]|nr:MAG: methyltransferase domain-containing protein [Candidatus Pacearchaeota archaeon]
MVYEPREDSFFFAKTLREYLSSHRVKRVLDMGCGSGILTRVASKFVGKNNVLACDINPEAVKSLKQEGFRAVVSNLFKNIKEKFDLIVFNAPYLPLDRTEPANSRIETTGGIYGDEISIKFLKECPRFLNNNGSVLLLISSITPMNRIRKFNPKILAKKRLFFEELLILEFRFPLPPPDNSQSDDNQDNYSCKKYPESGS